MYITSKVFLFVYLLHWMGAWDLNSGPHAWIAITYAQDCICPPPKLVLDVISLSLPLSRVTACKIFLVWVISGKYFLIFYYISTLKSIFLSLHFKLAFLSLCLYY